MDMTACYFFINVPNFEGLLTIICHIIVFIPEYTLLSDSCHRFGYIS